MKNKNLVGIGVVAIVAANLVAFLIFVALTVATLKANVFVTNQGVLAQLRDENLSVETVLVVNRNVFADTIIRVTSKDGEKVDCSVDTDILFNYEIKCPSSQ